MTERREGDGGERGGGVGVMGGCGGGGVAQCDKAMGVCCDMLCNVDWRVRKVNMRLDLVLKKEAG